MDLECSNIHSMYKQASTNNGRWPSSWKGNPFQETVSRVTLWKCFCICLFLGHHALMCVGPAKNACQLVNILDDTKLVLPTSSVVWKAGPCQLCSRTRLSIANLRAVFALAHIHLRQCMDTNPKHSIEKNIYLDTVLECCCSNQHVLYETNSSAVFYFFWLTRSVADGISNLLFGSVCDHQYMVQFFCKPIKCFPTQETTSEGHIWTNCKKWRRRNEFGNQLYL